MATLTTRQRKNLPRSAFAYPKSRSYPIHDLRHARAALARAAQRGTKGTYAHVAAAVRRRYGSKVASVSRGRGTIARPGYRKVGRRR